MSAVRVFSDQEKIAHYRILRLVASGGMGEVYEGWDEELQRRVALKVLNEKMSRNFQLLANFKEEGRALARLHHKNVVTVHTIGQHNGRHYIAMEYVNGTTLHQHVRDRKLNLQQTLTLFIQALEGLRVAHEAGVLHRDIKASNIMVHTNGTLKLVDFGLSRIQTSTLSVPALMKQEWGTAEFTAPEVLSGHPASRQSDIYAMGVVFLAILHGNKTNHLELFNLLRRMCATGPASRPASVDEVIVALVRILETDTNLNEVSLPVEIDDATLLLPETEVLTEERAQRGISWAKAVGLAVLAFALAVTGHQVTSPEGQRFIAQLSNRLIERRLGSDLVVKEPLIVPGTKFKFLYKIDSEDGGFVNEQVREWEVQPAGDGDFVWEDNTGAVEIFSSNPFIPPKQAKITAMRRADKIAYESDPLSVFPLNSKGGAVKLLEGDVHYDWSCWVSGRDAIKNFDDVFIVSCVARGGREGVEIFKYSPKIQHWVSRQRQGFGLPNMSVDLVSYTVPQ